MTRAERPCVSATATAVAGTVRGRCRQEPECAGFGWRCSWLAPLAIALGAPTTTAIAAEPQVSLVDDVGEGFVADAPVDGPLGSQTRAYHHPFGELTLQGNVLPKGLTAATFIDGFAASIGADGIPEVPVPSVPGGRAFQIGAPGEVQYTTLIFASADASFLAMLSTNPGATWDPIEFLEHVANLQIEQSGGPATLTPTEKIPPDLARYLPSRETDMGPFFLLSEFGGNEDLSDDLAANTRLVDFLSRNTLSGVQIWSTTDGKVLLGVSATRYPFERFASAVLGEVLQSDLKAIRLPGVSGQVRGAIAFEGIGAREHELGVAFRRGRFTFVTLADRDDDTTRQALVALVQRLADGAPAGASDAQPLPSSRKSIAAVGADHRRLRCCDGPRSSVADAPSRDGVGGTSSG